MLFRSLPQRLFLLSFYLLFAFTISVKALYLPSDAIVHNGTVQSRTPLPYGSQLSSSRRSVWSPKITNPNKMTKWTVGSNVTVSWDIHNAPEDITNTTGRMLLGYIDGDDGNEHLNIKHPLATGFDLRSGNISIRVPNVKPGANYIIVLFGDSGNRSPQFEIEHSTTER